MIRSRRAGELYQDKPLYARMLGLRHVTPSGFLCFVFLEGAVALGILLALAELVSWWGVLVLPITVAVMVKLNDVVAGALTKPPVLAAPRPSVVRRDEFAMNDGDRTVDLRRPMDTRGDRTVDLRRAERTVDLRGAGRAVAGAAAIDRVAVVRAWTDEREQRARQSAARRYE